MKQIPLVDLRRQYDRIKLEISVAMENVLTNSDFILGKDVDLFESEFADFVGVKHAVGVASGTDALVLALKACGIGPSDEILVPANTFIATAYAVSACGARPVLVDVRETDYNLDPDKLIGACTQRTRAILPVHLYGCTADMNAIREFAEKFGLLVIEDACQAHGARYGQELAGGMTKAGAFSFYPGKNLGAYGDGGGVTTNDDNIAKSVRMMRNYGQSKKYHHDIIGLNSRLDSLQAAVLRIKLKYLEEWNANRCQLARMYSEALEGLPITLPCAPASQFGHVYHLFVIRTERRNDLLSFLNTKGIGAGIHYPVPVHLHHAYESLGYKIGDFPVSERLSEEVLSLPIFPEMTHDELFHVVEMVKQFFGN